MDSKLIAANLERLHLTQPEASVYVALVEIGQTSAGEVIRKTGLHRSVVYNALDKLIDRKMVFKLIKKNISFYQPTNPDRIVDNAKAELELAQSLLPSLKSLVDTKLPEITVYEGVESYRRFWLDTVINLPLDSIDYVAGSTGAESFYTRLGDMGLKYDEIRLKKRIKWKMIIFNKDEIEIEYLKRYPELNEYRFLDKNFSKHGNFNLLNDQSLVLHSTIEPLVIEIKNKTLVAIFRNIFDILWESGKAMNDDSSFLSDRSH